MTALLPVTRDTLVDALATGGEEARQRALDLIARAYRAPVVALLGRRWPDADAEDLAQEFFARAIEKGWFARYDPSRGRFRAFLRTCLDDFARSAHRDARRLKRGGGATVIALEDADDVALGADDATQRLFEREWTRSVLTLACETLERECEGTSRAVAWWLFRRYDLTDVPDDRRPTYAILAQECGVPVTQVTNHLAWARRRMRELVLDTLRRLTADEAEYRAEVRALLGEGVT